MGRKIDWYTVTEYDRNDPWDAGRVVGRVRGKAAAQREVNRSTDALLVLASSESFMAAADAAVSAFAPKIGA